MKITDDARRIMDSIKKGYLSLKSGKIENGYQYCSIEKAYYDAIVRLAIELKCTKENIWIDKDGNCNNIEKLDSDYLKRILVILEKKKAKAVVRQLIKSSNRNARKISWIDDQVNFINNELEKR